MRYRVIADRVLTMDDQQETYSPGQVTWEDGRIVSVGSDQGDRIPVDQVIQVPGSTVMPGFLNGHNHAAMSLLRGLADDSPFFSWLTDHIWPAEAKLTPDDIYLGTMLAAAEMIRSGTVGFADMYYEVDRVAEAVMESGLRAWIARGLVGDQDPGDEKLSSAIAFAERWRVRGRGRIVPMLGPHAPYTCTPDYLARVSEAARDHDLGIHIHLAESADEIAQMKANYGRSPIQLAAEAGIFSVRTLIAHGVHIVEDDMVYLENLVGGVISCPVSNAKLGNGILPYQMLARHGVTVGLGTDGAASTNTLDMFEEMKAMAWFQKIREQKPEGFRAATALEAATRGTARVLGFDGGQLRVGAPADLIVVSSHEAHMTPEWDPVANLVYGGRGSDVIYTIVDGEILMAEGMITSFDERAVIEEARRRGAELRQESLS